MALFRKTKLCKFELAGMCTRGSACTFAHSPEELSSPPDFSKTDLCNSFFHHGLCAKGASCTFAHSKKELRPRIVDRLLAAAEAQIDERRLQQWTLREPRMPGAYPSAPPALAHEPLPQPRMPERCARPAQPMTAAPPALSPSGPARGLPLGPPPARAAPARGDAEEPRAPTPPLARFVAPAASQEGCRTPDPYSYTFHGQGCYDETSSGQATPVAMEAPAFQPPQLSQKLQSVKMEQEEASKFDARVEAVSRQRTQDDLDKIREADGEGSGRMGACWTSTSRWGSVGSSVSEGPQETAPTGSQVRETFLELMDSLAGMPSEKADRNDESDEGVNAEVDEHSGDDFYANLRVKNTFFELDAGPLEHRAVRTCPALPPFA